MKARIYTTYFDSPSVLAFCNKMGIEQATQEGARHRCPFLINLLDACAAVSQTTSSITVEKLVLSPDVLIGEGDDRREIAKARLEAIDASWPNRPPNLSELDLAELRHSFGSEFLTEGYYLRELLKVPDEQ